jgi:hypothetical protein
MIDPLYHGPDSARGTFTKSHGGIVLHDSHGLPRAYIRADGVGPVTCHRTNEGVLRFMFSTTERDAAFIGEPASYSATVEGAKHCARQVFTPAHEAAA